MVWGALAWVGVRRIEEGSQRREGRKEDAEGWLRCVGACWASQDRGVVRLWDPFCAPDRWNGWFSRGKRGNYFLDFEFGGLRKSGPECAPEGESASAGGGVGGGFSSVGMESG